VGDQSEVKSRCKQRSGSGARPRATAGRYAAP
jgi:hypothetical protein